MHQKLTSCIKNAIFVLMFIVVPCNLKKTLHKWKVSNDVVVGLLETAREIDIL